MRRTLAAMALLLVLAGSAAAQIAAPSMNPAVPFTNAPHNPAVLSWDGPSRVGLGYSDAKLEDLPPIGPGDGSVVSGQAQYVGAVFAGGLKLDSFSLDTPFGALDQTETRIELAALTTDWLSLGLSHEDLSRDEPGGSTLDETASTFGAVVRVGTFYFGGVAGSSDVDRSGVTGSRDVSRYGLAYLWQDKSGGLHVELANETRDAIASVDDAVSNNIVNVEARFGNLLLGYLSQSRELTDSAGVLTGTQDLDTTTLAWVPEHGLAVALAHTKLHGTGVSGGPDSLQFTSLGVSWLY